MSRWEAAAVGSRFMAGQPEVIVQDESVVVRPEGGRQHP